MPDCYLASPERHTVACRFLLVQGNPRVERDAAGAGWTKIADEGRPGDKSSATGCYQRNARMSERHAKKEDVNHGPGTFNLSLPKFLENGGREFAARESRQAVQKALDSGRLKGAESLPPRSRSDPGARGEVPLKRRSS